MANLEHDTWKLRIAALAILLGLMWFVWALDAVNPGPGSAAGIGVVPRTWSGLHGIPTMPFIHGSLEHILSNSVPLAVLGALIVMSGTADLIFVVLVSGLIGGLGTWLFGAGDAQHIGASGLLFGFFGYLVFRVAFDRRIVTALVTLGVAALYGTAFAVSLIPDESISWSGHFFGFLGGVVAARMRHPAARISSHTKRLLEQVEVLRPPFPR